MSSAYEQATRIIQRHCENERWSKLTLGPWRMGKWFFDFYVAAAIVLTAVVTLLFWSYNS